MFEWTYNVCNKLSKAHSKQNVSSNIVGMSVFFNYNVWKYDKAVSVAIDSNIVNHLKNSYHVCQNIVIQLYVGLDTMFLPNFLLEMLLKVSGIKFRAQTRINLNFRKNELAMFDIVGNETMI